MSSTCFYPYTLGLIYIYIIIYYELIKTNKKKEINNDEVAKKINEKILILAL